MKNESVIVSSYRSVDQWNYMRWKDKLEIENLNYVEKPDHLIIGNGDKLYYKIDRRSLLMIKGCPQLACFCEVHETDSSFNAQMQKDREYLKKLVKQYELEAEEKSGKKKI